MAEWNYRVFWEEALKQLREEFKEAGNEQEFVLWFGADYLGSAEREITAGVPSAFYRDQLNSRGYTSRLKSKLAELSGQDLRIRFEIKKKDAPPVAAADETPAASEFGATPSVRTARLAGHSGEAAAPKNRHPQLREDYTFETFVPGDNCSFAYNAALAVSRNPGKAYNPVLFYGGVGLGKTHLTQAVGNALFQAGVGRIIYVPAENFANDFINSLQAKKAQEFKNKYRNADALLLDDIHFLQKKMATQEELFYAFNALSQAFKQMVFTCDRPISELKGMNERLTSRFSSGLSVDLLPPDYETRKAILQKKLEIAHKDIPPDVLDLIAQNVSTNVRDLEAAMAKIVAYAELTDTAVTPETAQQQLRDIFCSPKGGAVSVEAIQKAVADHYNISFSDIKGKSHRKKIAEPRHVALYVASKLTEYSTTELGAEFGNRDLTTVMYSVAKIEKLITVDSVLDATVQALMREIKDREK
jgi:chromosomal replication initiator protein